MDKTGVPTNFVQRHLRFKSITKLCILTASHILKGLVSPTVRGRMNNYHRHFVIETRIKVQFLQAAFSYLLTTHIKFFLLIPKFPAYSTPLCKLHNT